MASYHMLAAGLCLLIVCASELSLAAPVEEEDESQSNHLDDYVDEVQTEVVPEDLPLSASITTTTTTSPVPETKPANDTTLTDSEPSSSKITSPSAAVILPNSTASAGQNVTKAANASVNSTESSLTTTSSTPTLTDASGKAEGTPPDEDKSTGENEKGAVLIEKKDGKYRFWWSDSTWMSVVIPVSVGLGSALILICWICCFRWVCCRRCGRGRSSFYKKKLPGSSSGPAKKALRDDFRQLRAKDRMKLLAETSDDEF